MANDLTNLKIKDTFQYVIQYRDGALYDLVGNPISIDTVSNTYTIVSSSYTIELTDNIIEVMTSDVTQSLPTAVNNVGKDFSIINSSTGSIRIEAFGSENINNDGTLDNYLIVFRGDAPTLISNNSNWRIK